MIEDVEDDVGELTDSDFSKVAAIIFDKIDNGKDGVLTLSKFVDFIETLGEVFNNSSMAASASPKISGGRFTAYSRRRGSVGFELVS